MFKTLTIDNLNLFLNKLNSFDRYYSSSDDVQSYRAGLKQEQEIEEICLNPDFKAIYSAWVEHVDRKDGGITEDQFYGRVLVIAGDAMSRQSMFDDSIGSAPTTPMELADAPTKQGDADFNMLDDLKFGDTAIGFLSNNTAASNYLVQRKEDAVKLYEIIKWRASNTPGVVESNIYTAKITKGFGGCGNKDNTITTKNGTMQYTTENCMLAYLLSAFW